MEWFVWLFQFCKHVAKFCVVDYHAVVEIEVNLTVGDDVKAVVVLTAFCNLGMQVVESAAILCIEQRHILKILHPLYEPVDVWQQVLRADALGGVGIHAVHVNQALECALLGREQPVNRPVLVHLLVVFPEVLDKVLVDVLV